VNHPGVIQLADNAGKLIVISLPTGATTTVQFGGLIDNTITIDSNQITFPDPGDPTTPFDPGFATGDPFAYPANNTAITGLTPGTIDYVILTGTPGIIQLASTPTDARNGVALPIAPAGGQTSADVFYATPFAPVDHRTLAVVQFGNIDTTTLAGDQHALVSDSIDGVNVAANLSMGESTYVSSGIGGTPALQDILTKPEVSSATSFKQWFGAAFGTKSPGSGKSAGDQVSKNPGTGKSPSVSVAGGIVAQLDFDTVIAEVAGTAKLESSQGVSVTATLTHTSNTTNTAGLTAGDSAKKTSAALAITFAYSAPVVKAQVDDNAVIDAAGTVKVNATTVYPFVALITVNALQSVTVYNPTNPSINPLNTAIGLFTDPMLGLGVDFINNSASAGASGGAVGSINLGGTIRVFVYLNDTEAPIGNARINQDVNDPNALGTGNAITFQNPAQSVLVAALTQYQTASETGKFALDTVGGRLPQVVVEPRTPTPA